MILTLILTFSAILVLQPGTPCMRDIDLSCCKCSMGESISLIWGCQVDPMPAANELRAKLDGSMLNYVCVCIEGGRTMFFQSQ